MLIRFTRATLALTLAVGTTSAFVTAVPAQAPRKMTLVQMHPNMGIGEEVFLYAVPKRMGYFAAEGLDVGPVRREMLDNPRRQQPFATMPPKNWACRFAHRSPLPKSKPICSALAAVGAGAANMSPWR